MAIYNIDSLYSIISNKAIKHAKCFYNQPLNITILLSRVWNIILQILYLSLFRKNVNIVKICIQLKNVPILGLDLI